MKLKTETSLNIDLEIFGSIKISFITLANVVLWFPLVFFLLDSASKLKAYTSKLLPLRKKYTNFSTMPILLSVYKIMTFINTNAGEKTASVNNYCGSFSVVSFILSAIQYKIFRYNFHSVVLKISWLVILFIEAFRVLPVACQLSFSRIYLKRFVVVRLG